MVLLLMLKRAFYLFCSFKNVLKVVCEESKSILHCFEGRFFQLHGEKISRSGEFTKKRSQSSKKKRSPPPPPLFFRKGKEDKEDKGAREKYFWSSIQRTRDRIEISFSTLYTTLLLEKIKYQKLFLLYGILKRREFWAREGESRRINNHGFIRRQ